MNYLEEPVSFRAGQEWFARKAELPTNLSAQELALQLPERVRSASFFSARVAAANVLGALREEVTAIAEGERSYSESRKRLTEFLASAGYGIPDPQAKGDRDLADIASTARLELVLRQNVAMQQAVAQREVSEHPAVLEIFPCYEYVTARDDAVREDHAALDGLVLRKDDPFWRTHFPPWDYNCRCMALDSEEDPNGAAAGFRSRGDGEDRDLADELTGTVENQGRPVNLVPPESGFAWRSDPASTLREPDFGIVEDPELRAQARAAWRKRFGDTD